MPIDTTARPSRAASLRLAAAGLAVLLLAHATSAQTKTLLITGGRAEGFTSDGQRVFGESFNSGPFVWDQVANLIGGNDIVGINAAGSLAAGNDWSLSPDQAAVWQGLGWTGIGGLPGADPAGCSGTLSSAWAMSDNDVIVGLAWDGCSAHAFKWTAGGGMVVLPTLGTSARANAISADGAVIGGHATDGPWKACVWDANDVQTILSHAQSDVLGFSNNGEWALGNIGGQPFRWSAATGITMIPVPDNVPPSVPDVQGLSGYAVGASDDGRIVVGYYGNILGSVGFVWEQGVGTLAAEEYFSDQGVVFPKDVQSVTDVTSDGRSFVVNVGGWILGNQDAYRVRLPTQFASLGFAKNGTNGLPQLTAQGDLGVGTEIDVDLVNALQSTSAYLVIGVAQLNLPFYGGTLVPGFQPPFGTFIVLPTDSAGEIHLSAAWPGGVPGGTDLYLQYWIVDGGGVGGFAASNAVHGEVP